MEKVKFLAVLFVLAVFAGCNNNDEVVLSSPVDYSQLNSVIAPWDKNNDLLPWRGANDIMVINSTYDVRATQTERFIAENPGWLNIDFSKKSIIAFRSLLYGYDHLLGLDVVSVLRYTDAEANHEYRGYYMLTLDECYSAGSDVEDESQYRIYQVAVVVDKIPSDAKVNVRHGRVGK